MVNKAERENFCRLIQSGMSRKGISLRELCRRADIDPSFMSKVFAGKRKAPMHDDILLKLASVLGINSAEIFISVGRLPNGWHRLKTDRCLFEKINTMIEKGEFFESKERKFSVSNSELPDELL